MDIYKWWYVKEKFGDYLDSISHLNRDLILARLYDILNEVFV